ncbi:MAG: polyprenyl synthetase family protein [Rhodocyclaceae bacterium]|nr:polyprenyl synthetase family protein [Rhodocyclaceae bacterium]MBP7080164.1 polyprenyl synthetase family protein [Rhodocyclaceae bacterium]
MDAVDVVIRQKLHSDVVLVRQVAEYIIGAGGKRMRPALVLASARACGYQGNHHHTLAAVIEFIHTATLLHDDVVDDSTLRRGAKTANAVYGNAASVLVGDFLYSRAFQMMLSVPGDRVTHVLADATNIIAEGEVLQLMNCHNADLSIEDYLHVVHFKTAKLFEAASQLGALVANVDEEIETGLKNYGKHLGTAFQIIDDVLDYSGDESQTGKHLGDDLAEGKTTLPLIHVMQYGSSNHADTVRTAIESGSRDDFAAVLAAVHSCDALPASRALGESEALAAKQSLNPVPESIFKKTLIEFADFAVLRRH